MAAALIDFGADLALSLAQEGVAMANERDQWAPAARPGHEDEGAHLRREGLTPDRHRAPHRTLAEALYYPGAEDVDFTPPKVPGKPS